MAIAYVLQMTLLIGLAGCNPNKSFEQQPAAAVSLSFDIPFGQTVSNDGVVSPNEWDASYALAVTGGDTFLIQHDGINLCVGYKRSPARLLFPEILIDRGNGKPAMWNARQQWYHVSGTDCFSDLSYADYGTTTCAPTQPDWQAQPNFIDPNHIPLFIEIKIPFDKLGIDYRGGERVMGIAFSLTDAQSVAPQITWPGSMDVHSPATWGSGTLQ
jgi:hypothetical protein